MTSRTRLGRTSLVVAMASISCAAELSAQGVVQRIQPSISRETTYFTEPVTDEGFVDYAAALNAHYGTGVTPEQNAATYLLKAFGPNQRDEAMREAYCRALGVPAMQREEKSFVVITDRPPDGVEISEWLKMRRDQEDLAFSGPWHDDECPIIADWLVRNAATFAFIEQAIRQPHCYLPAIRGDFMQSGTDLQGAPNCRQAARLLHARAMRRLADGDLDGCEHDILGMLAIADMTGTQPSILGVLVLHAIEGMAHRAALALCESADFSGSRSSDFAQRFGQRIPAESVLAAAYGVGERIDFLDVYSTLLQARFENSELVREFVSAYDFGEGRGGTEVAAELQAMIHSNVEVDWDESLRFGNRCHDRLSAAFAKSVPAEREYWLACMRDRLEEMHSRCSAPERVIHRLRTGSPQERGRVIAEVLLCTCGSVRLLEMVIESDKKMTARRTLTQAAFLLVAYRAEHGRFPAQIADLPSAFGEASWLDPFTGGSLVYRIEGKSASFYSLGPNLRDDAGVEHDVYTGADDISIKLTLD